MTTNAKHIEQLPILYGIEKNGKIKTWEANIYLKGTNMQTSHAFATIEHGQQDGKKQLTVRDYTEGKNIGKKNETTPLEQCIAETRRKWLDKKEKESYQETIPMMADEDTHTQAHAQTGQPAPTGGKKYFPMLAQNSNLNHPSPKSIPLHSPVLSNPN